MTGQPDDRLGKRDESRRPYAPTTVTGREVTRLVWRGLAGTAVLWLLLGLAGRRVNVLLLLIVCFAALVAARVVKAAHPPASEPPLPLAQASPLPADRPFYDVFRMEDRLAWGNADRAHFDGAVRPVLIRLIDERVRQRCGVSRAANPAYVRQLLGDDLWELVTAQRTMSGTAPGPSPVEVASLVEAIERI